MQKSIIRLTSVTYAIRAQKMLEQQGIRSTIKRITKSLQVSGCGYGIEINPIDTNSAKSILDAAGIRIVEITG